MFGWQMVGEPYRSTNKRYGAHLEFHDNGLWFTVFYGFMRACFVRYNGKGRLTGPGENLSVLGYFFKGPDRRKIDKSFKSGFAKAAAKPPVGQGTPCRHDPLAQRPLCEACYPTRKRVLPRYAAR
jgi:hypothetical protein